MKIHNTLTRKLEEFVPLEEDKVRMYTCGPTVYDYAHIGNFRAYMFEDLLRRYLKYQDFEVTQIMNLTDVDDKTIRGAQNEGVALNDYTAKYIEAFFADLDALNIERAEQYPPATGHVPEMIDLIQKLFDNGYAYQSDDGSVYFNVAKFEDYGKLAHIDKSGMQAGARVAQDEYEKENVADFALWKAWIEEDGDCVWDSPWGRGRPGWHIECSAMSMKYLGESFDIHTGGVDNIFPHHDNEIAQAEGATGKEFVRYWMHCGYLQVDGQKMSKSLGNFYTLRQIMEKGYSGREVRYVLLSSHYRQQINFTFDALLAARSSLGRLDEFQTRLGELAGDIGDAAAWGDLPEWANSAQKKFEDALDDDLNAAEAFAAIFDMVHDGNRAMDSAELDDRGASATIHLLEQLDRVLGFLRSDGEEAPAEAIAMAAQRETARAEKNWAEADRLRDEVIALGWTIKDTPEGPRLRKGDA